MRSPWSGASSFGAAPNHQATHATPPDRNERPRHHASAAGHWHSPPDPSGSCGPRERTNTCVSPLTWTDSPYPGSPRPARLRSCRADATEEPAAAIPPHTHTHLTNCTAQFATEPHPLTYPPGYTSRERRPRRWVSTRSVMTQSSRSCWPGLSSRPEGGLVAGFVGGRCRARDGAHDVPILGALPGPVRHVVVADAWMPE